MNGTIIFTAKWMDNAELGEGNDPDVELELDYSSPPW